MKYIKPDKIFYHPDSLIDFKHGQVTYPITAEVHLSNRCNNKCFYCGQKNNHNNIDMSMETIKILPEFLRNTHIKAVYFSGGGEPTLNKKMFHVFDSIREDIDLGMITNGLIMTDTLIDWYVNRFTWVRISIDSGLKDTYKKIRGTNSFDKVIKNIEKLLSQKQKTNSKTTIGLQIVINEYNYFNLIEHCMKLLEKLPYIDYIQVRPIETLISENPYDYNHIDKNLFENNIKLLKKDNKINVSNKFDDFFESKRSFGYSACHASNFIYTIDVNGNVYPCCHVIGNEEYRICNITSGSYFQGRKNYFSELRHGGFDPNICLYNCRGSGINRNIESMMNEKHVNFL